MSRTDVGPMAAGSRQNAALAGVTAQLVAQPGLAGQGRQSQAVQEPPALGKPDVEQVAGPQANRFPGIVETGQRLVEHDRHGHPPADLGQGSDFRVPHGLFHAGDSVLQQRFDPGHRLASMPGLVGVQPQVDARPGPAPDPPQSARRRPCRESRP